MKNKAQTKNTNKRTIVIISAAAVLVIAALSLYFLVLRPGQQSREVTAQNKDNAETLKAEKDQEPVIIDENTAIESETSEQNSAGDTATQNPTVDTSGLSTNLERAEVKPAVSAVFAMYQDFLAKLQAVPASQRQAVADQYLADNASKFSANYSYLSGDTLHLFPQGASTKLPEGVSINSAIVNPDDSTQTIVQVFLQPDTPWSLLVYVKMNGNQIATFEKLVVRMNQNPL